MLPRRGWWECGCGVNPGIGELGELRPVGTLGRSPDSSAGPGGWGNRQAGEWGNVFLGGGGRKVQGSGVENYITL